MHFLQIDGPRFNILDSAYGFQIRTSYLFADVSTIVGNTTFLITYDYIIKNLSLTRLCELVLRYPDSPPEIIEIIEGYFQMLKTMKALKHAPNNVFIAFKKVERSIQIAIKPILSGISTHAKSCGFEGIFELYKDDFFVFYNPEVDSISHKNTTINIFKVLANKAPINAIDVSIWLLPNIFYVSDIFDSDAITDINLIEENKPYLIKCITLTNYVFVSPAELTAIKQQLENEIIPFKKAMEQWAMDCHKSTNGIDSFKNKVLPTLKDTQAVIENNALFRHSRSVEAGKMVIDLHFGEVSPLLLWHYYLLHNVITDEEYNQLIEEYNTISPYTIPVILFAPDNLPFSRIDIEYYSKLGEIKLNTEVTATKKSIDIDG